MPIIESADLSPLIPDASDEYREKLVTLAEEIIQAHVLDPTNEPIPDPAPAKVIIAAKRVALRLHDSLEGAPLVQEALGDYSYTLLQSGQGPTLLTEALSLNAEERRLLSPYVASAIMTINTLGPETIEANPAYTFQQT